MVTLRNPVFCDIGITENCMFKCRMCRLWQSPRNSGELSMDEWKKFITSLGEFGGNNIRLHFAGGEPLIREDMLDIIEFADRKGFTTVMVTNGFMIDEAMAGRIVRSGLDVISISLDTTNADTHDFLRGVEGAHRQAVRAIGYLHSNGMKSISILAVIMGVNLHDLTGLVEWVEEDKRLSSIYLQAISQPIATPKDPQWHSKEEYSYLWPKDGATVDSVIERLMDLKKKGYKISNNIRQLETFKFYFKQPSKLRDGMVCNQGDYVIYVRPTGEVFLCGSMPPIGNIRTHNIKDLWGSEEAILRRRQIYECRESCLNVINCFENKDLP